MSSSQRPADPGRPVLPAPVLVLEDEPLLQLRLRKILLNLGYPPHALHFAATLADARACVASLPVALALIDLALPDGHGQTLIRELRTMDPGLGILVVSAWSSEEAIMGALRAGATGYVLKERDDFEVMLSIRSVLRGGAHRPVHRPAHPGHAAQAGQHRTRAAGAPSRNRSPDRARG